MKPQHSFFHLFTTQFLGVLNDNLLKNLIVFIGAAMVGGQTAQVSATAAVLLILPYVLFSGFAAKLANAYSRVKVVKWAKLAEIPIMIVASVGLLSESINVLYIALFFMGLQSALYSPSKYGLIKDLGGESRLSKGNGAMEMLSFVGILLGSLIGGLVSNNYMESKSIILITSSGLLIGLAVVGWIASLGLKTDTISKEHDSILSWKELYANRGHRLNVFGNAAFWLVASLIHLTALQYCPEVLGLGPANTGFILGGVAVAIALGCLTAGFLSKDRVELGLVPLGLIGMTFSFIPVLGGTSSQLVFLLSLSSAAFFSGFWKVALNANLQKYAGKGQINGLLAKNNQIVFVFIIISSAIYYGVQEVLGIDVMFTVVFTFVVVLMVMSLRLLLPNFIRLMLFIVGRVLYKYKVLGKVNVPVNGGALLVSNHVSYLDSLLIVLAIPRHVRFVMVSKAYYNPWMHWFFKRTNMIPIDGGTSLEKLKAFNARCREEIREGHVVCIFAEGQLSRNGQLQKFKRGVEHIMDGLDAPVIPFQMSGVHGTPMSFNVAKQKPVGFNRKSVGRKVVLHVGEPFTFKPTAFQVRQKIKEMEVVSQYELVSDVKMDELVKSKSKCDAVAYSTLQKDYSFAELFELSDHAASHIWTLCKHESKIGIALPYGLEYIVYSLAAARLGKRVVLLEMGDEIDAQLNRHRVKTVIAEANVDSESRLIEPRLDHEVISFPKMKGLGLSVIQGSENPESALVQQDVAMMFRAVAQIFKVDHAPIARTAYPAHSKIGFLMAVCYPWYTGQSFTTSETGGAFVGTTQDVLNVDLTGVSHAVVLDKSIDLDVIERLNHTYPNLYVFTGICADKTGLPVAMNSTDFECEGFDGRKLVQHGSNLASVGRPLPGVAIKILDKVRSQLELGPGKVGEVWVRKLASSAGAWRCLHIDGYLDEEGFLSLV